MMSDQPSELKWTPTPYYLSAESQEVSLCLTTNQIQALLGYVQPMEWVSRWIKTSYREDLWTSAEREQIRAFAHDLEYRLLMALNEPVECNPEEAESDCYAYGPRSSIYTYEPVTPWHEGDLPDAYNLKPFVEVSELVGGLPIGFETGDIWVNNLSLALPANPFDLPAFLLDLAESGLPRISFQVDVSEQAEVELHFNTAPQGGLVLISYQRQGAALPTVEFMDTSAASLADFESWLSALEVVIGLISGDKQIATAIAELQLEESGTYDIHMTWLPKISLADPLGSGFGGGFKYAVLCGAVPSEGEVSLTPEFRLAGGCVLEYRNSPTDEWSILGNVCGSDGATGPQGPIGETGPQGPIGPQGPEGGGGVGDCCGEPWQKSKEQDLDENPPVNFNICGGVEEIADRLILAVDNAIVARATSPEEPESATELRIYQAMILAVVAGVAIVGAPVLFAGAVFAGAAVGLVGLQIRLDDALEANDDDPLLARNEVIAELESWLAPFKRRLYCELKEASTLTEWHLYKAIQAASIEVNSQFSRDLAFSFTLANYLDAYVTGTRFNNSACDEYECPLEVESEWCIELDYTVADGIFHPAYEIGDFTVQVGGRDNAAGGVVTDGLLFLTSGSSGLFVRLRSINTSLEGSFEVLAYQVETLGLKPASGLKILSKHGSVELPGTPVGETTFSFPLGHSTYTKVFDEPVPTNALSFEFEEIGGTGSNRSRVQKIRVWGNGPYTFPENDPCS